MTTTGDFAVPSGYTCNSSLPATVGPGSYSGFYATCTPMQTGGAEAGAIAVGRTAGNFTINPSGTAQAATQAIGITPKL